MQIGDAKCSDGTVVVPFLSCLIVSSDGGHGPRALLGVKPFSPTHFQPALDSFKILKVSASN